MPRKLSRTMRLSTIAATAAAALFAAPAGASAAECTYGPTSPAFSQFGDTASYYLAPNGGFEQTLSWAKSGAVSQVTGNEPFYLAGLSHNKSLRLQKDARVTTPPLCISPETPHLRFVAKAAGGGQLDVEVRFYQNGKVTDSSSGSVSPSDHAAWAPSRTVDLKTSKLLPGQTGTVTVTFRSQGDWLVDDVFIDPRMRR
jgi:hypothetical protein